MRKRQYPCVEIHLDALRNNLTLINYMKSGAKLLAIVKGNAYGHGLAQIAKSLTQCKYHNNPQNIVDGLGVGRISEAIRLRAAGIDSKIVVLEGCHHKEELDLAYKLKLDLAVNNSYQINLLKKGDYKNLSIWLNIDVGMNFMGFHASEVKAIYPILKKMPQVKSVTMMAHCLRSREFDNEISLEQNQLFKEITKDCPEERSAASSSTLLNFPEIEHDWVRIGYMLYGYHHQHSKDNKFKDYVSKLKPLLKLKSEVIDIKILAANEHIGYTDKGLSNTSRKLAIIAIGYADGYPRNLPIGTPVVIKNQIATLASDVTMDKIAVDISHIENVNIGDEVSLWGDSPSIYEIAKLSQANPIELICRLTERVNFIYYDGNQTINI